MAYNLVKVLHVLFIARGLGANITYGFWQGLAGNNPERNSLILRGVKFLDDRVGKPVGELDRQQAEGDGRVQDRARPFDATISSDRTLYDAFSQMLIHQANWVVVVDGARLYGVLTPESFVTAIQRVPAEVEGVTARR